VNPVNPSGLPTFYVPFPLPLFPFIGKRETSQRAQEGLEKLSEKKDNMVRVSCLAFLILIGCSPFWAKVSCRFL
jgi:hypothetical protein